MYTKINSWFMTWIRLVATRNTICISNWNNGFGYYSYCEQGNMTRCGTNFWIYWFITITKDTIWRYLQSKRQKHPTKDILEKQATRNELSVELACFCIKVVNAVGVVRHCNINVRLLGMDYYHRLMFLGVFCNHIVQNWSVITRSARLLELTVARVTRMPELS